MALAYDRNGKPIRPIHPKEPEGFYRAVPYNWMVYNQQKIEYCNDLEEYEKIMGSNSAYSYCSNCGAGMKRLDAFCGKCGAKNKINF